MIYLLLLESYWCVDSQDWLWRWKDEKKRWFFADAETEFIWCSKCERVYFDIEWEHGFWTCPTAGCSGSELDAHPWLADDLPRKDNPGYPEVPLVSLRYPLHPE